MVPKLIALKIFLISPPLSDFVIMSELSQRKVDVKSRQRVKLEFTGENTNYVKFSSKIGNKLSERFIEREKERKIIKYLKFF